MTKSKESSGLKVWIDLDNSPHVPFFFPIIHELKKRGHHVVLTGRNCFQVCGLCKHYKLNYTMIGHHYGKNILMKGLGTIWRAMQLAPLVIREKPDLAVSHGSRSLIIAAAMLRIRDVLIFDYEHSAKLPIIKVDLGLVPEYIDAAPMKGLFKQGVRKYSGLKEDVYAPGLVPNPVIYSELGLDPNNIIVTIRPPATEAHYHSPESQTLFTAVVNSLGAHPNVQMVILPRNEITQTEFVRKTWANWCDSGKIIIPDHVVDGLNLIWHSDLVVSGGGTMNREAAALGVPVFSIFRGKLGAVDKYLAANGRLTLLEEPEELAHKIVPAKRKRSDHYKNTESHTLSQLVELVLSVLN